MTPMKKRKLLASINAMATKVYDCVPKQAEWTMQQIENEMARLGMSPTRRVVQSILGDLHEAGLIKYTGQFYTQVATSKPKKREKFTVAKKDDIPEELGVMDEVADLSMRLRAIADDLDNTALRMQETIEAGEAEMTQLRQLKAILRNLDS